MDDSSHLKIILEQPGSPSNKFDNSDVVDHLLLWLPNIVKEFIFPSGFPGMTMIVQLTEELFEYVNMDI